MSLYAELAVTTNFSFLRGASHPEELVARAAALGLAGIGIADRNSLAGVVRAHAAAREEAVTATGLRVVTGCRLVFCDGTPDILAYPRDRAAYGRLCRLLTVGNARAIKGDCRLTIDDLIDHAEGLLLAVMPASTAHEDEQQPLEDDRWAGETERIAAETALDAGAEAARSRIRLVTSDTDDPPRSHRPPPVDPPDDSIERLKQAAPGSLWVAAVMTHGGLDRRRLAERADYARRLGLPLLAVGDVMMHDPARRRLADCLTAIRHRTTLMAAGRRLAAHAEHHLKPSPEMARLFRDQPQAIAETRRFLDRIDFSLDELCYEYPEETREGFSDAQSALEAFTREGAARRYPAGVPDKVRTALDHELALIAGLDYAPYFLTVHDIVRFARSRGILCQGRGSAANSAVCFCLGITEVDPAKSDLLFERFVSAERREPPDIDVDFEHERREEVMQYIYQRYGRHRAGLAASVITYRARSAIREIGKVFGLSEDAVSALSGAIWGWSTASSRPEDAARIGLAPDDPKVATMLDLAREIVGFPRHLSQHTGGFVITRSCLDTVIPIANAAMADRTVVEWDKDDLDTLGILKIDILALGMLSCLRKAFDLLDRHYGRPLTIAGLPAEDPATYRMISRADTLGVFQIESRAQMSMLPRLRPQTFYDLVIEVAIVRPGPIQGDMVHPYLRRRQGLEPVSFPSKELEGVLGKTLGVPLFQEQAMKIAIVAAGFTPSEADRLRRAMATFRRVGTIGTFATKMVEGMVARGYERDFAERCFKQIEGFGEYGFPESHAASFALLVYASCWLKCHYPDVFACALLNAQPMGFYAPAQIVRDAREHGVEVRAVDINHSGWDQTLERAGHAADRLDQRHQSMRSDIWATHAIRLGFRQIKGLAEADLRRLCDRRGKGYDSVRDVWLRAELSPAALERLAEADAFRSLGLDRREALWAVKALNRAGGQDDLPLFAAAAPVREPDADLPPMPLGEHVIEDYRFLRLSLKAHPVAFVRQELAGLGVVPSASLEPIAQAPHGHGRKRGAGVAVAGLVIVRQRPGTAKGVIFMTLEDETGIANVIVWPTVFELFRPIVLGARFVRVKGHVQSESGVIHVIAETVEDMTPLLDKITTRTEALEPQSRADEVKRPQDDPREGSRLKKATRHHRLETLLAEEPGLAADLERLKGTRTVLPKGRNFH
ncbi:MAG: error-prone DNA polymerase [Labrys sp. (in: a-proteobacteria)]